MARGDEFAVVYVDGDVPQLPIQLGQLLVDSSLISPGNTNLQQCTSQSPVIYEGIQGYYPRTPAETAAGVVPTNYFIPSHLATGWVAIERYGADPTATLSSTAALDAAILVSANAYQATIRAFCGRYRFSTKPTNIGYGIMIEGPGSQGTNELYGTVFLVDYSASDFLVWDGTGGAGFRGTGGGLKNVLVIKADTRTGGVALKLYATDDNHRPGEMYFENVLVFGTGTGSWEKAIEIDGRNANTPGARGVRSTYFQKVRVADCTADNEYIHFMQATHVYGNVQMDTGSASGILGMTIDDIWDHIDLDLRVGNVIVNYTGPDNPDLNLRGSCDSLDINSTAVIGTAVLKTTTSITNQATLFRISSWLVDDFTAFLSSTAGNVTGDGTAYTILFDTESYDTNSSYDPTTGIYTVKVAGDCGIDFGTVLTSLGAAHTTGELLLDHRTSGGSSRNQISTKFGVGPARDAANQCGIQNHIKLRVFEGDTLKVTVTVSGSTKTVGVGGAATRYTYFSCKTLA